MLILIIRKQINLSLCSYREGLPVVANVSLQRWVER